MSRPVRVYIKKIQFIKFSLKINSKIKNYYQLRHLEVRVCHQIAPIYARVDI